MGVSFGQVIPVTGPTLGFPGSASRLASDVITARQLLPTATLNLAFGAPAVIIPNAAGGGDTFDSVADFIAYYSGTAANAGLVATQFAGFAIREVKTAITWTAGTTPGVQSVGFYQPGEEAEVKELGSIPVIVAAGVPQSQQQVYTRVALNVAQVPGGTVGDVEAISTAANDSVSTTGTAASGTTLAVASPSNIVAGQVISGAGIAPGTSVVSINGSNVTLSKAVTAALSSTPVVFSNQVALPNVVFRTGFIDSVTNVAEVTIKVRNAA
jgi:hypothetical protein